MSGGTPLHPLVERFISDSLSEGPGGFAVSNEALEAFRRQMLDSEPRTAGVVAQDLLRFASVIVGRSRPVAEALTALAERVAQAGCLKRGLLAPDAEVAKVVEGGKKFLVFAATQEDRPEIGPRTAPEGTKRIAELYPIRG